MKAFRKIAWILAGALVLAGGVCLMSGSGEQKPAEQQSAPVATRKRPAPAKAKQERRRPIDRLQRAAKVANPATPSKGRAEKIVTVTPDAILAFNAAVESGLSVMEAGEKVFADGIDTDGVLAALTVMSRSADPKLRRGAYQAVARLFTDEQDLTTAITTAKALLDAQPTVADDARQSISLGDESAEAQAGKGEVASEASHEDGTAAEVVDDSEAEGTDDGTGESDLAVADGTDPVCDAAQSEALANLLKSGVADADGEVRQEALRTASQLDNHFKYDAYGAVLKGTDAALKQSVLALCSGFGCEEDVGIQRQALQDADPAIAAAAQKYLDSDSAKAFLAADAAAKAADAAADGN